MNSTSIDSTGSARKLQNSSAQQVLGTLAPVLGVSVAALAVFFILRRITPRIYSPRTFVGALRPQERTRPLPKGFVDAFTTFFRTSDHHVLNAQSLDAYMFLRLLRVAVISCFVGCMVIWPILLPVNATGPGGAKQLNILTISNAASASQPQSYNRYYAHVLCAYIFFGFIIYMITRETIYFINVRQAYLVSPMYANRVSSRTVLFSSVPDEYLDEMILRQLLGEDVVANVWIPRHVSKLSDMVSQRDGLAMKLEDAEIQLIKDVNKARLKAIKKNPKYNQEELHSLNKDDSPHRNSEVSTLEGDWRKSTRRPRHKPKFLVGTKVDTIDWCKEELTRLMPIVEAMQADHRAGKGKPHNSAFVEFKSLRDAQSAFQSLTHHKASRMAPRFTGMYPEEVIWPNLRIKWWERIIRQFLVIAFVVALVVLWSFPVAFIQAITNVDNLENIKWLAWLKFLNKLPNVTTGLVSGLLPAALLALIMVLLPPVLRVAHQLAGDPTFSAVEYSVQNSYFWFQVIQVFLVTTLSSGAIKVLAELFQRPQSVVTLLADALPASSNFYLSYVVLQGLGVVSNTLLAIASLVLYYGLGLFDKKPRSKYNRWRSLNDPGLGSMYPIYTNLFIIAISYSCIAPLVLGFAGIGLFFFYLAYRYEFLYVYHVPYDTKGLMYPRALQQLFVGLYLAQLCLIGLFSTQISKSPIVLGPFAMMIVLLVFTVLYHYSLNRSFSPLLKYLPKTLETEEQRLLAMEMTQAGGEEYTDYKGSDGAALEHPPSGPIDKAALDKSKNRPKPNFLRKWLRPDIYSDYYTLRQMVPTHFGIHYDDNVESLAYFHPAVTAEVPILWVPKDEAGVSVEECRETSRVIPMSDGGGAVLTTNGKIVWTWDDADKVPIAKDKILW